MTLQSVNSSTNHSDNNDDERSVSFSQKPGKLREFDKKQLFVSLIDF